MRRRPSSKTFVRHSTLPRSSPTPRASTRLPLLPKNMAGISIWLPWHASGVAAASSVRSSSTVFPKRSNQVKPTCRCCSLRTSRTPSKPPKSLGVTWWLRPPSTVCLLRRRFLAVVLRRTAFQAPARRPDPGSARLFRRSHLPARGPAGRVPHPVGRAGPRGNRSLIDVFLQRI